ncbi:MAG TPA: diacylglycerol kinase family protein [Candidatus Dormibacteraeota bacterium]|nr:diacylglycerol kinase family protein [Candidatus Dormibacteraeota bacterium]
MYYYIINPAAGKGAINNIQDKLRSRLTELGISGEFAKTTGPGDAAKIAELAVKKGMNTIVAVGGDDTVNEVINGISRENNTAIGIIPTGSSNLLAGHLGIHDWQQACEVLAARRITSYGLIAAGQKFFLSTLVLGFETQLEDRAENGSKEGLKDKIKQFKTSFDQAKNFKPLKCKITVDSKYELTSPLFSLTVANQKFDNPLADNKLIISLTEKPSRWDLTNYAWQLLKKTPGRLENISTRVKADRAVIEINPETQVMIDGNLAGKTPIVIRLTDRRIRFITEKQSGNFKN